MLSVDMDKVTEIIREVSAEEIAPRFGQLGKDDIDTKTHAMDLLRKRQLEALPVRTLNSKVKQEQEAPQRFNLPGSLLFRKDLQMRLE